MRFLGSVSERFKRFLADRAGTAAIEFAMVAPVFLLLAGGLFSGGMVFYARDTMQMYTREAARAVSLGYETASAAKSAAETKIEGQLGLDVTVSITAPASNATGEVSVTTSITKAELQKVTPFGRVVPNGITVSSKLEKFTKS